MVQLLRSIEAISPHAEPILVISLTAILGLLLGSIRIRGMKLGVAGMLFSGLLLGHFGMSLDPQLMAFLKEFGLVLFVFTVGLQLGPGFVNSLKSDGLKLNSIAVMVVLSGALIAFGVGHFLKWDIGVTAGILSGGTTNTPSLGAAQQAMATATNDPQRLSAHHAVAHLGGADGGAMALLKTQVRMAEAGTSPYSHNSSAGEGGTEAQKHGEIGFPRSPTSIVCERAASRLAGDSG
jgi:putative transport protein